MRSHIPVLLPADPTLGLLDALLESLDRGRSTAAISAVEFLSLPRVSR
jgi:hypothetical protein